MSKNYRFKTEVGIDKEVRLQIEQDFDFLEILSLKLRQEDIYDRYCADYGVVAGRVVANGGFGIPNVNVSVFVPLDNIDENLFSEILSKNKMATAALLDWGGMGPNKQKILELLKTTDLEVIRL